jgi:hypothetical protein
MPWDNNPGGQQEGLPDLAGMSKDNFDMRKERL